MQFGELYHSRKIVDAGSHSPCPLNYPSLSTICQLDPWCCLNGSWAIRDFWITGVALYSSRRGKDICLPSHFDLNIFSQEYQKSDRMPQKIFNESLLLNLTPLLHSTDMNPRRDRYGTQTKLQDKLYIALWIFPSTLHVLSMSYIYWLNSLLLWFLTFRSNLF